jgi:hypothetical protein
MRINIIKKTKELKKFFYIQLALSRQSCEKLAYSLAAERTRPCLHIPTQLRTAMRRRLAISVQVLVLVM